MSTLFPDYVPRQGHAFRIYYSKPWKHAYVYVVNGLVTHASPALVFTLGWTREKVIARVEKVGFSYTRIDAMKPKDTWLTARPAPVQIPLPHQQHAFIEPDLSFMRVTPPPSQGCWQVNPLIVPPMFTDKVPTVPQRDALGRFISKNPTKSKKKGKV